VIKLDKYEYKVLNAKQNKELRFIWKHPDTFENILTEMGQNGWKLVTERDLGGTWTLIFLRKIED